MKLRRLAEQLSRGVVLRRRLPAPFLNLPLYVTPEAGLRYWLAMSKVDPLLYRMVKELVHPGSRVWDVGANVGLFSFCAAACAGNFGFVLAIEPDLWLAQLMMRSSREIARRRLPCSNVEILCASISNSNCISKLEIAERARASNHLLQTSGSPEVGGRRHLQPTVSLTLDFLLDHFPAPSVVKIDVETHEVSVLRGAYKLLTEVRPTILCEVSHQNSDAVTAHLHSVGYELYGAELDPHPLTPKAWFQTLAVPASR